MELHSFFTENNFSVLKKQGYHHNGDQAARRAHIRPFDLRSLTRGFGKNCTIVEGIIPEPENVLSIRAYYYLIVLH